MKNSKKIVTVREIMDDCELFGKASCGWVAVDLSEVPHALKIAKPIVTKWVQKVYAYPRKGECAVRKNGFFPL